MYIHVYVHIDIYVYTHKLTVHTQTDSHTIIYMYMYRSTFTYKYTREKHSYGRPDSKQIVNLKIQHWPQPALPSTPSRPTPAPPPSARTTSMRICLSSSSSSFWLCIFMHRTAALQALTPLPFPCHATWRSRDVG